MTTPHHEMRIDAVIGELDRAEARCILDLGCGDGDLLLRLAGLSRIQRIVGVDLSAAALDRLRRRTLTPAKSFAADIHLVCGSMMGPLGSLGEIDAAVLLESIEHINPHELSKLEHELFRNVRPKLVVMTTPNADYNPILGVPSHRYRHPDHRFEWGRERFRTWSSGVARRGGYEVRHADIVGAHPRLGGSSQMAVFELRDRSPVSSFPNAAA